MKVENLKMNDQKYAGSGVMELSKEEMQSYEGGFAWIPVIAVVAAVVVLGGAAYKGYQDGKRNENARCR
jgi:hypothetical protein